MLTSTPFGPTIDYHGSSLPYEPSLLVGGSGFSSLLLPTDGANRIGSYPVRAG